MNKAIQINDVILETKRALNKFGYGIIGHKPQRLIANRNRDVFIIQFRWRDIKGGKFKYGGRDLRDIECLLIPYGKMLSVIIDKNSGEYYSYLITTHNYKSSFDIRHAYRGIKGVETNLAEMPILKQEQLI